MGYWFLNASIIFLLCALLAGVLIPQILLIAYRKNLFDSVDERKIHTGQIPRLGGMAFVPVIMISIVSALVVNVGAGWMYFAETFGLVFMPMLSTFIALELLYLVGIADDLIGVKYRAKFVVQLLCAVLLIVAGIWFDDLNGVFGITAVPEWFGWPFTAVVIVFIINAFNLIDGIDGLASGLSSIVCLIYGFTFMFLGCYAYAMVSFATLGVLIPFLYYNVFGNVERHSKIFMGDTGSLTIGVLLAVMGIKLWTYDGTGEIGSHTAVLASSPLIVPSFDVIRVYMLRIRQHHSPFLPDKNHIHHKLLAAGFSPRSAMITIVMVSALLCAFNFALAVYLRININLIVVLDVVLWVLFNLWINKRKSALGA